MSGPCWFDVPSLRLRDGGGRNSVWRKRKVNLQKSCTCGYGRITSKRAIKLPSHRLPRLEACAHNGDKLSTICYLWHIHHGIHNNQYLWWNDSTRTPGMPWPAGVCPAPSTAATLHSSGNPSCSCKTLQRRLSWQGPTTAPKHKKAFIHPGWGL